MFVKFPKSSPHTNKQNCPFVTQVTPAWLRITLGSDDNDKNNQHNTQPSMLLRVRKKVGGEYPMAHRQAILCGRLKGKEP